MEENKQYDVFLIGAGIMSATLGTILKTLKPDFKMGLVERGGIVSQESSGAKNNSGTGHSGFCELNYDLKKAIHTCESFEQSKQFWAYLVERGHIKPNFINQVPHISFVQGQENVDELKERWTEMKKINLFEEMEFTTDPETLKRWMPLVMHRRLSLNRADMSPAMAATRMNKGTDINFGLLTSNLLDYLTRVGVDSSFYKEVTSIKRNGLKWDVTFKDRINQKETTITTKFLFIGAGGATLTLLQKSGIPEAKGYGGFPVSGQFLMCETPEVVNKHNAKVYGKPELGSPPMSVPHLDTRIINGKKVLLFGPFAGISSKFLKNGHWTDFFKSLRFSNIFTILSAGLRNLGLSKYLVKEVTKTSKGRFETLLSYYPDADIKDWKPIIAGQRVQVIKKDNGVPTIEFGTEIVTSEDGTLAAILGASPGGSTSVHIMIEIIEKCFRKDKNWSDFMYKLSKIIPSYKDPLSENMELFNEVEEFTNKHLNLGKE